MIREEEVIKIARLAKIKFFEEEFDKIKQDLNKIFDMVDEFQAIKVDLPPLVNVLESSLELDDDKIVYDDLSEQVLQNAPSFNHDVNKQNLAKEVKCFIVPKVIE